MLPLNRAKASFAFPKIFLQTSRSRKRDPVSRTVKRSTGNLVRLSGSSAVAVKPRTTPAVKEKLEETKKSVKVVSHSHCTSSVAGQSFRTRTPLQRASGTESAVAHGQQASSWLFTECNLHRIRVFLGRRKGSLNLTEVQHSRHS